MRSIIIGMVFILSFTNINAQIVNVESKRLKSDTTGWLGSLGTSFQFEKGAVQLINIEAEANLAYKTPRSIYLLLANYNLLQGEEQTFQNNLFYHLRYTYKFDNVLRWEAFNQMQQNNVAGIQVRFLVGTGPRFKISGTDKLALYAATAVMHEYEKEINKPVIVHKDIRSSSYISLTWKPVKNTEIINTFFYQPLFKELSDYRLLQELSLEFNFTKNFAFVTTWNYLFDSEPVVNIPRQIFVLKNGIRYQF